MRRYILILIIILIGINSYSNGFIELSGYVIFKETKEKIENIGVNIISHDLSIDTTIFTDDNGLYKILLPQSHYILMTSNDSLIGVSSVDLEFTKAIDLIAYFNYQNDYKIFRNGFQQIFISNNSETLGLKSNGEFRRTIFVGIYAAYSFTENGFYEIKGDTIITEVKSVDCYNGMNTDRIGHIDSYIKSPNSPFYLIDKSKNRLEMIQFNDLEKIYKNN